MSQYQGSPNQRYGHITYSQHFDDGFIVNIFDLLGINKPSYLDIGAHHPTDISNTALLYQRGSRGVNVEPNPNLIEAFKRERPEDINLNVGVAASEGTHPFFMYDATSGLNTFSEVERDGFVKDHPQHPVTEVKQLGVVTINQIVEQHMGNRWPNLITIDVEGLDFEILSSMQLPSDLTERPEVICVEVRQWDSDRFRRLMEVLGYYSLARMFENMIFVRHELTGKLR